ncbi:KH domain-containing protein [Howardella ureilytica]|mgnify:CR=1 FL=1|nr:KH domain-containing protein [Lachnospiraceae bacterium]MDY2956640.1 KH domain-containing protein [Lachnospiraceae bacterium]
MEKFVEYIVKSLVDDKERVTVYSVRQGDLTSIHVKTAPGDLGKIIGISGRIAQSIRVLVAARAAENAKNIKVCIDEQ